MTSSDLNGRPQTPDGPLLEKQERVAALAANKAAACEWPEGGTPVDLEVLRQANLDFASENQRLRQALRFYANGAHWECEGAARFLWDTVSGEPQNWHYRENDTGDSEGIENGGIAKMALRGDEINWDGEEPMPVEGEPEHEVLRAAHLAERGELKAAPPEWLTLLMSAQKADWGQVVMNGGPPCFAILDGKFCLRAERWQGHGMSDHHFLSLEGLLGSLQERYQDLAMNYRAALSARPDCGRKDKA